MDGEKTKIHFLVFKLNVHQPSDQESLEVDFHIRTPSKWALDIGVYRKPCRT